MPITINLTIDAAILEAKAECASGVKRCRESYRENLRDVKKGAKQIAKLSVLLPAEVECHVGSMYGYISPIVTFDRKLLAVVRKAVGRLTVVGKHLANAETRQIQISLKAEKFPNVRFSYNRTLPPAEACTCDIVEVTRPAFTYKTLVCRPVGEKPAAVEPVATAAVETPVVQAVTA